jgi:hypothetical protein
MKDDPMMGIYSMRAIVTNPRMQQIITNKSFNDEIPLTNLENLRIPLNL